MATTPNWEQSNVANATKRRDYADGWDRGYSGPYYPKEREAIVLANIAKVSPAFVKGYWEGRCHDERAEWIEEQLTIEDAMRFRSGRSG